MKKYFDKIPPIFKNFYFISFLMFLTWMFLIDNNNFFNLMKLNKKENSLNKSKVFYEDKIIEVKNKKESILSDPESLEKLAREKYLMKKKGEDVFIIVDE